MKDMRDKQQTKEKYKEEDEDKSDQGSSDSDSEDEFPTSNNISHEKGFGKVIFSATINLSP
jgi:hypothetical protein